MKAQVAFARVLLLATLAALLLQGVIPSGMMPDFSRHNTAVMKMCDGMMSMPMKMPDKPASPHKDMPCPYAMAAHLFLPLLIVILLAGIPVTAVPMPLWRSQRPRSLPIGNVAARGPPIFS